MCCPSCGKAGIRLVAFTDAAAVLHIIGPGHRVIKITESRVHRRSVIGREDPSDHFRKREVLHPGSNVERAGGDAGSLRARLCS
jgi:hypothetical protein